MSRLVHAVDPPQWWCEGDVDFDNPVAYVGIGHSAAPRGWPTYRCNVCGEIGFYANRTEQDTSAIEAAVAARRSEARLQPGRLLNPPPRRSNLKPRIYAYLIAIVMVALIWRVASADAHRLSGHPKSLAGKLVLAKRQVQHDRSPGSHHWVGRDRVYVNQLQQLIAPPLGPSWLVNAFWCIHRYEGAWNAHTGNGYYGGLQFDYSFMRSYGREFLARYGTADRWPPGVQIHVAIRAYLSGRGFYPWPNTARACGLL